MTDTRVPLLRSWECPAAEMRKAAATGRLFVVVDSCSVPLAPKKALELGPERAVSLYRGTTEEEFSDVAPYLVQVDPAFLDWLAAAKATEGWGIFVASSVGLDNLRQHFRRYLKVRAPAGEIWVFRFYDPRVLRLFLPACNADELRAFYGPVVAFGFGDPQIEKTIFQEENRKSLGGSNLLTSPGYPFMFQLREQHVEGLEVQAELSFAQEVVVFLQRMHSKFIAGLSEDELKKRVFFGLSRARRYGFEEQASFAGFVAIMFRVGPNFDEQSSIHRVLTDPEVPPDLRLTDIQSRTSDQDWEEAVSKSQAGLWE